MATRRNVLVVGGAGGIGMRCRRGPVRTPVIEANYALGWNLFAGADAVLAALQAER